MFINRSINKIWKCPFDFVIKENMLEKTIIQIYSLQSKLSLYSIRMKAINIFFSEYIDKTNNLLIIFSEKMEILSMNKMYLDDIKEKTKTPKENTEENHKEYYENLFAYYELHLKRDDKEKSKKELMYLIKSNGDNFKNSMERFKRILSFLSSLNNDKLFSLIKNSKDLPSDKFVDKLSEVLHTEFPEEEFDFTMPEDIVKIPEEPKENENK